ncbi:hypothetical protein AVEN_50812-1 [Araneus ventricosus]|uniref:Uncharacterized protein n=1 Tax=Araneus ventricosus TaxID=182803 RepID=A0A4Y2IWS7_ARAVE|nr:hypothetical protein AVEN_50812-1 [Araneus ventricosus]
MESHGNPKISGRLPDPMFNSHMLRSVQRSEYLLLVNLLQSGLDFMQFSMTSARVPLGTTGSVSEVASDYYYLASKRLIVIHQTSQKKSQHNEDRLL